MSDRWYIPVDFGGLKVKSGLQPLTMAEHDKETRTPLNKYYNYISIKLDYLNKGRQSS